MPKKAITTPKAKAIGPYSQAVVHNGMAYLSGQIPLDPATGQLVESDIAAQTTRVLENLKAVLEACGSGLDQVLKTTVYIQDMREFAKMNAVYARMFGDHRPARTTVQVTALPGEGMRIEIDAIAYRP